MGVLKAMEELALEPDIYVGASAGAIASAFFSQGFTASQLADWVRPFYKGTGAETNPMRGRYFLGAPNLEQLSQPGYLTSGLLSIDRFERFLAEKLPQNDFRALNKDVFVTASDIDGRRCTPMVCELTT